MRLQLTQSACLFVSCCFSHYFYASSCRRFFGCRGCLVTKDAFPAPCDRFSARSVEKVLQFWKEGSIGGRLMDYPGIETADELAIHLGGYS